jgi:hypothetical protein
VPLSVVSKLDALETSILLSIKIHSASFCEQLSQLTNAGPTRKFFIPQSAEPSFISVSR